MVTATPDMTGVSGRRWRLRGRFPDGALDGAPYQALVRHLLWHRGLRDLAQAGRFMAAEDPRHDPALLPDIEPALQRLRRAVEKSEKIAVYGDFDVDGVTSSAILVEALRDLGAPVQAYIPDRFTEGYGVNTAAIESLAGGGVSLIITADCGTGSVAEIARAHQMGADTIVIDHHTVPPELPRAVALVNPKRADGRYPEDELSSGGLAYRVMEALYLRLGRTWDPDRHLDLAALSTVCDMAPLRGENRWIVREGLRVLSRARRPGIRALLENANGEVRAVDADTIGYVLGPRLNAAGRLSNARAALDVLMERDEAKAREGALELSRLNKLRQSETQRAILLAEELLQSEDPEAPLIFIGHPDIPSGIVGLVAGRLAERRNRPAIVYERGENTSRASCRSIPEFHITDALRGCSNLLLRFGGHRAAAGFTASNENLAALKEALVKAAREELRGVDLTPVLDIDARIPLDRVNGAFFKDIQKLAPFGVGNPEPLFLSQGVDVIEARSVGDDAMHLKLKFKAGRATWSAIAFGLADGGEHGLEPGHRLDIVYTFCADGRDGAIELRVSDFAVSGT
jgi:single-stranded-DNA-specific exonuclease